VADDSCRTGVHRPYALPEYGSAHHSADRRGAAAPPWVAIWGVTASISRPPALGCTHLARWQDGGFRVGLHDKSTRVKGVHTPTRSTWVAVCIATLPLPGCWVAPNAHVQPKGEPRLIEEGVEVQSVKDTAVIREIDATTRTIVVSPTGGGATESYRAGAQVSNFDRLKVGQKIQSTLAEELSVYVLRDGQLPDSRGEVQTIAANAKVLSVDPAYRLLTVQYPSGQSETFKVGLQTRLDLMAAGDDVVIRIVEAVVVKPKRR